MAAAVTALASASAGLSGNAGFTIKITAAASKPFEGLTKEIGTALGDFEHQYLMEVVLNGGGEERSNGQAGRNKKQPD